MTNSVIEKMPSSSPPLDLAPLPDTIKPVGVDDASAPVLSIGEMDQVFVEPLNGGDDESSNSSEITKDDMDQLIADLQDGEDVDNDEARLMTSTATDGLSIKPIDFPQVQVDGQTEFILSDDANVPAAEPEDPSTWLQFADSMADPAQDESESSDEEQSESSEDGEEGEAEEDDDEVQIVEPQDERASPKRPAVFDGTAPANKRQRDQRLTEAAEQQLPKIIRKPSLTEDSAVANFILSPWT